MIALGRRGNSFFYQSNLPVNILLGYRTGDGTLDAVFFGGAADALLHNTPEIRRVGAGFENDFQFVRGFSRRKDVAAQRQQQREADDAQNQRGYRQIVMSLHPSASFSSVSIGRRISTRVPQPLRLE